MSRMKKGLPGVIVSCVFSIAVLITISGCATPGPSRSVPTEGLDFIGNIWGNSVHSDADFARYWNQVTVENGGKWGSAEPSRDTMQWYNLDVPYRYAKDNGIPFRLHTLVWGQQQPDWIGVLGVEEQQEEIREWFSLLSERYPDVDLIDVVNEPLHETPSYSRALTDDEPVYREWISASFRLAREYFPHASLGINDYNILSTVAAARSYARLVADLKDAGLVDHIGVQGHFLEDKSIDVVRDALDVLAELELPIYITEFDLNIADDELQAQRMEEFITTFAANPWVRGITLWGYKEGAIWREEAYLLRADGTERPALIWLKEYCDQYFK